MKPQQTYSVVQITVAIDKRTKEANQNENLHSHQCCSEYIDYFFNHVFYD